MSLEIKVEKRGNEWYYASARSKDGKSSSAFSSDVLEAINRAIALLK